MATRDAGDGALTVADELPALRHEIERLESAVAFEHRRAAFLSEAGTILLSASVDLQGSLQRLAKLAVETVADWFVMDLTGAKGNITQFIVAHADPAKVELAHRLRDRYPPDPSTPGGLYQVLRTGKAELREWISDDEVLLLARDDLHREWLLEAEIRSYLIVPLLARGRTLGAMTLVSSDPQRHFGGEDLEMIVALSHKVALAVDNARLYASEQRARERTEKLQALTIDLATALTVNRIAEVTVSHGVDVVGARLGALWVLDVAGTHALLLGSTGSSSATAAHFSRMRLDLSPPFAEVVRTRTPLFFDSVEELTRRYIDVPASAWTALPPGVASYSVLPLVAAGAPLGVLIFGFDEGALDLPDQQAFLVLLAEQCAQALHRAELHESERRSRQEVELLYGLLDAISRTDDIDRVLERALDAICRALRLERASVLLLDDGGVMRFSAWRGLSDDYRAAVEGHSPWSADAVDPEPILIADVAGEPSLAHWMPLFQREGIAALAFFPLVHQHRLLGKFMVYSGAPRALTPAETRLGRLIASQVADALARTVAESRARSARVAAEAANRAKDEFLAAVSHELRTPLSAILGWAALLGDRQRTDEPTLRKGLEIIERNARAQAKIIDDILDVSRIITGKLVIDLHPVGLVGIVNDVLETVRAPASAKGIEVSFHHDPEPWSVVGDSERLRQVVWNLLSNAIKFTQHGGRVSVTLRHEQNAVAIDVTDSGKGISPEFLPHVFERFWQADATTTRREGGLGLGLAIVRHLVELHGGQVRAASPGLGRGATFTAVLPVSAERASVAPGSSSPRADAVDRPTPPPPSAAHILADIRVLVVDDEPDARELLSEALARCGAHVRTVAGAPDALAAIADWSPDVLVSDIGMPDEDGYSLLRKVRGLAEPARRIPAIALTAYARPEDRQRALAAGFQLHVPKPVRSIDLARAVRDLHEAKGQPNTG
jgi:signal transduction histidine kinase/ActR/RegA family two-component response regulator